MNYDLKQNIITELLKNESEDEMDTNNNDQWAVVELMGHLTISGRVTKPGEYGGLWQIDVPEEDSFRTEFFGSQSVYRIRMVSEEIARAYAVPSHEVLEYNAPIVTRAEFENALQHVRSENYKLQNANEVLKRRLTAVISLPERLDVEGDDESLL